jgi:hypothetical protein
MSSSGDRRDARDCEAGPEISLGRGKEQQWEIILRIEESIRLDIRQLGCIRTSLGTADWK